MPTAKKSAANRMNVQKSTGPGVNQGQAASRYNVAKHGIVATTQIMFDETAEDLAELAAEYHEHYNPANPNARFLVDTLIANEWRLRRMRRVEAELWAHATNAFLLENTELPACSSGDAFATASGQFERLQRIVNSCERNYRRALKELAARDPGGAHSQRTPESEAGPAPVPQPEAEPTAPSDASQPEQSKPTSANLGSFRQNHETPLPAATQPPPVAPLGDPAAAQPSPGKSGSVIIDVV
jgi:hypothetical protein